ncbi:hypothetical protein CANCADRAFT_68390 [Tortispora caseinolytica NRRL Y-17796]|uniref:Phosphodiesterase n=1 Tax=Tortispora caseinolytica NRRL Y-17796 TaxID=767744 RepID=A0A1E4TEY5_9ASCO|nr:hypothetical protein CANCADRAFT_68390 [Tortispora caseinolytica NRRL Y-17796]
MSQNSTILFLTDYHTSLTPDHLSSDSIHPHLQQITPLNALVQSSDNVFIQSVIPSVADILASFPDTQYLILVAYFKDHSVTDQLSKLSRSFTLANINSLAVLVSNDHSTCSDGLLLLTESQFTDDGILNLLLSGKLNSQTNDQPLWIGFDPNTTTTKPNSKIISMFMTAMQYNLSFPTTDEPYPTFSESEINDLSAQIHSWDFKPYELSHTQQIHICFLILNHAMKSSSVQPLSDSSLWSFVKTAASFYSNENPYHNFIHATDVLQCMYYFLVSIGALDGFLPLTGSDANPEISPVDSQDSIGYSFGANIIDPDSAFAFLLAALGHDFGHPGLTNAFLSKQEAPLAKIYSHRSILESLHAASFTRYIAQCWPAVFQLTNSRELIVESILATDMGRHFVYLSRFRNSFRKFQEAAEISVSDVTDKKALSAQHRLALLRTLGCILLKCADISNVTRKLEISIYWGRILGKEFKRIEVLQGELSGSDNSNPSLETGSKEEVLALAKSQLFFIDTFARDLFTALSGTFPELQLTTDMVYSHGNHWQSVAENSI